MVHTIRKLVANLLYYSGLTRLCYRCGNRKAMILAYHRVFDVAEGFDYDSSNVSVSIDNFSRQMKFLSENYNVISLDKFLGYIRDRVSLPKNVVVITFDDGYLDTYKYAYPVLKKLGLPATIYLTTNYIDNNKLIWWDALAHIVNSTKVKSLEIDEIGRISLDDKPKIFNRLKALLKNMHDNKKNSMLITLSKKLNVKIPSERMFMDWQHVRVMSKNNISFGAHTCTHPILTNIPLKEAKSEIVMSKSVIEKHLGKRISSFAYPNGHKEDFNDDIIAILKKNGFESAVTYIPGWADANSNLFSLDRIFVKYEDDMIIFKNKLIGMDIFFGKLYYFFNRLRGKGR